MTVTVMDPTRASIRDQIVQLARTTLFVSPMGGIDASAAFVPPRSTILLVGQRDGVMMCGHCYSHTGPLVLFSNATNAALGVTFDGLQSLVYKGLLSAERRFGLRHSFARPAA